MRLTYRIDNKDLEIRYEKQRDTSLMIRFEESEFLIFLSEEGRLEVLFAYEPLSAGKQPEGDLVMLRLSRQITKRESEYRLFKFLLENFEKFVSDKVTLISTVQFAVTLTIRALLDDALIDEDDTIAVLSTAFDRLIMQFYMLLFSDEGFRALIEEDEEEVVEYE